MDVMCRQRGWIKATLQQLGHKCTGWWLWTVVTILTDFSLSVFWHIAVCLDGWEESTGSPPVNTGDESLAFTVGMYTSQTGTHKEARRHICSRMPSFLLKKVLLLNLHLCFYPSLPAPTTPPLHSQRHSFRSLQVITRPVMKTATTVCLQNCRWARRVLWACCLCLLHQRHWPRAASHLLIR